MPEWMETVRRNGARIELALLGMRGQRPRGTINWLNCVSYDAHHHLAADNQADYERLVRRLSGKAWGLVLGGGGARGLAHIGAIRALREGGIPIDAIAGTSMGSILGAQYAMGTDPVAMLAMTRKAYVGGGSDWADLTVPLVSLRTGRGTFARLEEMFGDLQIEDLPIPYFCVSSNLSRAIPVIHHRGPVAMGTRVSCSVPGLLPPVPWDGDILVDGAMLNNLPVDEMRKLVRGPVAASDVSVAVDLTVSGDLPRATSWSGKSQMMSKFRHRPGLPNIMGLLMRMAEIGSVRDSKVSGSPADLYLQLPVGEYAMTDFDAIDRIVELGYVYTLGRLKELNSTADGVTTIKD
jgi:predicted acylesterase/phospholipase RssA